LHMSTEKKPKKEKREALEVKVPEGVTIDIKGSEVETKGSLGTNKRTFNDALLVVQKGDGKITISSIKDPILAKKAMKAEQSFKKELENDISGVTQHFERNMKAVFAHFPINMEVKGDRLNINNIIGERTPRIAKIVGSAKIEVKGQALRVYGTSLDEVSQTAANIRLACRIRNKDSRVFQDGLYYELK
jgi:large subunit ribosomal protein L6